MSRPARMIDVAKLARVSAMTVSRVLSGNTRVAAETRERVFAAIEQLRYQPNELARSLREQRSRQIGIIVPYLFDPFFARCAHAISTVAREHAYSVVLSTCNEDPQTEFEEANRMLRRNVEGLIVVPAARKGQRSLLVGHPFETLPMVSLDRPIEKSHFPSVLVENEHGARIGTEHLLRLGHREVAYIGLSDDLFTMRMRQAGYLAAMKQAGLRPELAQLSGALDDAFSTLQPLLARPRPVTAVFCANNLVARHVLHSLRAMNFSPPAPVALVGFDDFETAALLGPGITVVRQPIEQLARTAAEILFAQLAGERLPSAGRNVILPVELVVRGSCGAPA